MKATQFYVLWVANESQDQAPHDANKLRMSEAEALTQMAPLRLEKSKEVVSVESE